MKSFLLSTALTAAFTLIVSFAAAGCTTSDVETTIAQSCTTLDCRCGGC